MKQSTWEKGQGCYNAIMIPVLILCGIAAPFMLIFCIRHPDFESTVGEIISAAFFTLADLIAIIWFINSKVKKYEKKRRISKEYHSRDVKGYVPLDSRNVKYMKICPRCMWIPHSGYVWIEHKGTEQETCYYCHIPLATTNCTEEEFNRSDELKKLVFNYFAAQKAFDMDTYKKRVRNDLVLKKQMLERRRQEEQQNQQNQPPQSSQPSKLYQPRPQPQPSQAAQPQAQAQPPLPTLTTCPVCQGKVSIAATACPHCGQPLSAGKIATR